MPIPMTITPGTIPAGTCPTSEQNRLNLYASLLSITFPLTAANLNYGNTVPIPDQQSFPWYRLNSDGTPDGLYVYSNGAWIRPHPVPANSPVLSFYNGAAAGIPTYDGGDGSSTITAASGAMWQVATTDGLAPAADGSNVIMYGGFPMGANTTYPQGTIGGAATVILTTDQLPAHTHPAPPGNLFIMDAGSATGGGSSFGFGISSVTGSTGSSNPITTLPPYLAGIWIQRTSRMFYTAS